MQRKLFGRLEKVELKKQEPNVKKEINENCTNQTVIDTVDIERKKKKQE